MRDEVNQAKAAGATAASTAAGYGSDASTIGSTLTPFLTRQMTNPGGMSQQDIGQQLTASLAGAGGATSALTGAANRNMAATRNPNGFSSALDAAARSRDKAAAMGSESIAGKNADVKLQQQSGAEKTLAGLYGTDVSGQNAASGQIAGDVKAAADANQTGWLQNTNTTMLDLSEEAKNWSEATGGFAGCPAKGSLYLMADGIEKTVEHLTIGELLEGIDDEPEEIEEIQCDTVPVVKVTTEDGFVARNSYVHAYALPNGGFVVAPHALGKMIRTANGTSRVASVVPDGTDLVFNVITNGSHTYRADGIWSLGVGEAERQVDMKTWARAGKKLSQGKERQ